MWGLRFGVYGAVSPCGCYETGLELDFGGKKTLKNGKCGPEIRGSLRFYLVTRAKNARYLGSLFKSGDAVRLPGLTLTPRKLTKY